MAEREMRLGMTDGFMYMGFRPPLDGEEVDGLPRVNYGENGEHSLDFSSVEIDRDGSLKIGVDSWPFHKPEDIWQIAQGEDGLDVQRFVGYALNVAAYAGATSIDTEVRSIGPGSLFEQEEPA